MKKKLYNIIIIILCMNCYKKIYNFFFKLFYKKNKNNNYEKIIYINFDINNYLNQLFNNNCIYNYFNESNLLNKKLLNFNIKLQIIKGKINNLNIILNYDIYTTIKIKYYIIPDNIFHLNEIIKIETYINSLQIRKKIYYNSNNINNIITTLFNINKNIILKNYNIDIYDNHIIFMII